MASEKKAYFKRDIKGATMPYLKSAPFKGKERREERRTGERERGKKKEKS